MPVNLYGRTLDLSTFKHPGGKHMIDMLERSDSPECLFEYYHVPQKMKRFIDKYTISEQDKDNEEIKDPDNQYSAFKNIVKEHVSTKKQYYKNMDLSIHILCYISLPITYSIYITTQLNSVFNFLLLGTCAFIWSFATIWISHGNSHGIGFVNLAKHTSMICAINTETWATEHTISHHINTGQVDDENHLLDPDILLPSPVMRWHPNEPLYWFHKYQHFYVYPFIAVGGAGLAFVELISLLRNSFTILQINRKMPLKLNLNQQLYAIFGQLVRIVTYVFGPYLLNNETLLQSVIKCAVFWSLTGCGNFFINIITHTNEKMIYKNYSKDELRQNKMKIQLENTIDVTPGNQLANILTAGLNHQAVHHICPGYPFTSYSEISKLLKDFCKKEDIVYNTFDSYYDTFCSHHRQLRILGTKE